MVDKGQSASLWSLLKRPVASRNIAFKADMMSQAVLEVQTPEARGLEASSERHSRDDDDVERNADFDFIFIYIFNHEVAQR